MDVPVALPSSLAPSSVHAAKPRLLKYAQYLAFFFAFFAIIYIRRSEQLSHPQVWDEDGTVLVPDYLNHGLISLLHPLNGYLVLVPRLISVISLRISIFYYPNISTLLTCVFTICVCMAITFCPTWLRGRALLGFCVLLVPSDPEVIAIPLDTFWWASLLLFLVVLWQNDSRDLFLRTLFILIAGLSTPIIALVTPLLAVRLILLDHKRRNGFLFCIALACAVVQFLELHYSPTVKTHNPTTQDLLEIMPRFFGNYVLGNFWDNRILLWIVGSATFAFILLAIRWTSKKPAIPFLLFLCLGSILMAAMRNPLEILAPAHGGPRYFFFPFVLLSWILVNLFLIDNRIFFRAGAAILLIFALANVFPVLSRKHINLRWQDHLASAPHFAEYSIPIQIDGYCEPWYLPIQRTQARALLAADPWATPHRLEEAHPFAFTIISINPSSIPSQRNFATTSILTNSSRPVANSAATNIPGFTVVGSNEANKLSIPIRLHRGENILYLSGSDTRHQFVGIPNTATHFAFNLPVSSSWVILDFSSDQLPDEFTANFSDQGTGPGEWFAIALKNTLP